MTTVEVPFDTGTDTDVDIDIDTALVVGGRGATARGRRLLMGCVLVAILIAETVLLWPYVARAATTLRRPEPWWSALAIAAEFVSMAAFARVQQRMLSTGGPRVPVCRMARLTYAANALSVTLPGGSALSSGYVFRRFRSWGASVSAAGFTVVASGLLSTVAFATLAVTCALLAGGGSLGSLLVLVVVATAAIAITLTGSRRGTDLMVRAAGRGLTKANRLLHRAPDAGLAAMQRFARELTSIKPRWRDWFVGLGFAALNWVADLACLFASCQAVGANGSTVVHVMAAYVAGMSVSSLSLLPGGFGVVDATMVFALTRGGVATMSATAAVVLYRLISFALNVALGWALWTAAWFAERRQGAGSRAQILRDDEANAVRVYSVG
jgi:putative heme transporter